MIRFEKKLNRFFVIALLFFATIASLFVYEMIEKRDAIVLGSKCNTEQEILAEAFAQLIENKLGLNVVRTHLDGTLICFYSLLSGNIDAYIEYTGTGLFDILKEREVPDDLYAYLQSRFQREYQLQWLKPLGFSNQFCLIARAEEGVNTVSTLVQRPGLQCAFGAEFLPRLEYALLNEGYDRLWGKKQMDQALLYVSLAHRGVDVITGSTTDGSLHDVRFVALEEDKGLFPRCDACLLISQKTLAKDPKLEEVCNRLAGKIDESMMRRYNWLAEQGKTPIPELAAQLLSDIGELSLDFGE